MADMSGSGGPSIQSLVQQAREAGVNTDDPKQMKSILDAYRATLRERPAEDGGLPPPQVDVQAGTPEILSRVTPGVLPMEDIWAQMRAAGIDPSDEKQAAPVLQAFRDAAQGKDAPPAEPSPQSAPVASQASPPAAGGTTALERLVSQYQMPPSRPAAPGGGPVTGPLVSTVLGGAAPTGAHSAPKTGAAKPPGRMGELDASYQAQQEGLTQAAAVGQQRAVEAAAAKDEAYKQAVALAAKQQAGDNERQRYRQEQMGKLEQATAHFQQLASRGIDPSRYYASQDTGQKILAGIGIFLGGFGGGANQALGIVNSAVERDIQAQKAQLEGAGAGVDAQRNLLGVMRQNFSDDAAAEAATRKTMLELAAQRMDAMAAKYEAPETKAKAAMASGQLRGEAAKAGMTFSNQIEETAIKRMDAVTKRMAVLEKPGLAGRGMTGAEANKIGDADSALKVLDVLDREWGDKAAAGYSGVSQYIPATDASRYATKARAAAQVLGNYLEGGKLSDKDYDKYLGLMPSAGDAKKTKDEKVKTLRELVANKRDAELGAEQSAGFNTSGFQRRTMDLSDLGGKRVK